MNINNKSDIAYKTIGEVENVSIKLSVYNLFDKRICYEKDCYKLLDKSIEYIQNMDKKNYYFLINYVKDKHTYVNRINFLLAIFKKLKSINKHSI